MQTPGLARLVPELSVTPVSRSVQKLVAQNHFGKRVDEDAFIARLRRADQLGEQLANAIAFERKRLHKRVRLGLVNVTRQTRPEGIEVDEELESHWLSVCNANCKATPAGWPRPGPRVC